MGARWGWLVKVGGLGKGWENAKQNGAKVKARGNLARGNVSAKVVLKELVAGVVYSHECGTLQITQRHSTRRHARERVNCSMRSVTKSTPQYSTAEAVDGSTWKLCKNRHKLLFKRHR